MPVKIATIMRLPSLKTTLFIIIGILSLLAQGLAFAPARFNFILHLLPAWGNLTFGIGLFLITLVALAVMIRTWGFGSYANWTLLVIQAAAVFGMYFLQDSFASRVGDACFLFTGLITTLTVIGILTNRPSLPETITPISEDIIEIEIPE